MPIIKRLQIVHALGQLVRAGGEQAVCRAFEEQERRPRLQLRILLQQLAIARLERAQMLLFLFRELLEDAAAARVAGDARGAGVEIEPAPFGRNSDPKRVAREQKLRHTFFGDLRPPVWQPSQVPWICSTLWRGVKPRAAATSSTSASMSELRNSNDLLQVLQIRWKCRGCR